MLVFTLGQSDWFSFFSGENDSPCARVSLLDTTFQNLEHATIGTVLTTLNAGSVVLTIFPNLNVHLRDPTLSTRFKVQVQLMGAPQDGVALAASLQH